MFCLPPHSTHLLQPLDVGLFAPLQHHYGKRVEKYHQTTNQGITHSKFLPIYQEARRKAYTSQNIESAFKKCGIVPFNPRAVLGTTIRSTKPPPATATNSESFFLDKTPYTKCQLRQQTNRALTFIKTATPGQLCKLILRFSHAVEYGLTTAEIAVTDMQRLRKEIKEIKPGQRDQRVVSKARVVTGEEVVEEMQRMDAAAKARKDRLASGLRCRQGRPSKNQSRPASEAASTSTTTTAASAVDPPPSPALADPPAPSPPTPSPPTPARRRRGRPPKNQSRPKAASTSAATAAASAADPPPSPALADPPTPSPPAAAHRRRGRPPQPPLAAEDPFAVPTGTTLAPQRHVRVPATPKKKVRFNFGGAPRSLPRARLLNLQQSDISSEDSDTDSDSLTVIDTPLPSRPVLKLNTPQAPNPRYPDRPLGMSLRNRKSGGL